MAHKVFVCHSSIDQQIAGAACAALEEQRISCWIAPRDILAGVEYGKAIIDALSSCQVVLLIFSGHANDSVQVRREIERAVSKEKIIVPFRIENVLPSDAMEFALSNTQWLDATTPPLELHLSELCVTIARLLDAKTDIRPPLSRVGKPVPSLPFTVGYLNAKANWIAISAIQAFCLNKSGAKVEVFAKYLQRSGLASTLSDLNSLASKAGWPSRGTLEMLSTLNGLEWLCRAVQVIFAKAPSKDFRDRELQSLSDEIEGLAKKVFIEADGARADIGMVFLGNQIGKLDALLVLGMQAGESELDKLVTVCRGWIKAIFLAHLAFGSGLQERVSWIISFNPGLSSKVDSMTSSELAVFVGRAKDGYLMVSDK